MSDSNSISFAVDTNFISGAVRHTNSPSMQLLLSDAIRVFTSRTCFEEVQKGEPSGEIELLREIGALVLGRPTDPEALGPDVWRAGEVPTNEGHLRAEEFLIDIFIKIAGTKAKLDLTESLSKTVDMILAPVVEDMRKLGLDTVSDKLRSEEQNAVRDTPMHHRNAEFTISSDEMRTNRIGPKFLNNYTPPKIVEKIFSNFKGEAQSELQKFFPPCAPANCLSLQTAGLVLITTGFEKDKRIQKENLQTSRKGGVSQWRDLEHIVTCAGANCFVTLDAGCAKLAFALYEAFSIKTNVFHITPNEFPHEKLRLVNQEYWP